MHFERVAIVTGKIAFFDNFSERYPSVKGSKKFLGILHLQERSNAMKVSGRGWTLTHSNNQSTG